MNGALSRPCGTVKTMHEYLVLTQQERQEHKHSSVMNNPPDINVALGEALTVGWIRSNVLWHQKSQVSCRRFPYNLYKREKTRHCNFQLCGSDLLTS